MHEYDGLVQPTLVLRCKRGFDIPATEKPLADVSSLRAVTYSKGHLPRDEVNAGSGTIFSPKVLPTCELSFKAYRPVI